MIVIEHGRSTSWMCLAVITFLFGAACEPSGFAQSGPCTHEALNKLGTESTEIRDWQRLHSFFLRYQSCKVDSAEIAEGISESIARILADHWSTLPEAQRYFAANHAFEIFALRGINATDGSGDLKRIDNLAKRHCPGDLAPLCAKIRAAIRESY